MMSEFTNDNDDPQTGWTVSEKESILSDIKNLIEIVKLILDKLESKS